MFTSSPILSITRYGTSGGTKVIPRLRTMPNCGFYPFTLKKNTHDYGKTVPFKAVFPFYYKEIL